MDSYNNLIKKDFQIFVCEMYRSGATVMARILVGEQNIAFASDPIRPFFQ